MDWNDSPEQAAFRTTVQDFIKTKLPARYQGGEGDDFEGGWSLDRRSENPEHRQAAQDWVKALAANGWVAPHWPKEYGGASLSPMEQFILKMEMAKAAAPNVGGSGVSMLGPTLIVHG
ncbi:MAG: acyl-CoA dehydrogenase family protein, partial [Dehalococcoidia bacterium]|nr:acyl-CoA dehydrogenase family protein [Dehalococcoidia bacterium]